MRNRVSVSKEDLKTTSENLKLAFNIFCGKPMELNAYKDSKNYDKLVRAIKETTGISLSSSTLRDLITLKHRGRFHYDTFCAIDKFIATYTNTPLSFPLDENYSTPIKQKTFWSVNQDYKPGVFINGFNGQFIEWPQIKKEIEAKIISQCPRIIPVGSGVVLEDFYGKKNWVIWIVDKELNKIGSVWIGGNPYNKCHLDGLIRIGKTFTDTSWEVWQILQRYSDGSYRIVQSFV
jgi:hypothetical protein